MLFRRIFPVTLPAVLVVGCDDKPQRIPPKDPAATVLPIAETAPMPDGDDAADDSAIWVNTSDPARSLIIGTNKRRGLFVYDLAGKELSKREDGRMNNVDLRQNVVVGSFSGDLVAATNRDKKTIDVYGFDGAAAALAPLLSIPTGFNDPYGLCLYRSAKSGDLYVIANNADDGVVGQWRIVSHGSALDAEQLRNFGVGSQAEGCAADDENGVLFVAEEDVGLYAYWAEPDAAKEHNNARLIVDTVNKGHLTADAEGITILKTPDGGGYVIVSSQGSNSYNVYDRAPPFAFRGAFQIGPTSEENGIDVVGANLGGPFSEGLFVAQDGYNYPGTAESRRANQNFKLVPWAQIRAALKLPEAGPAPEAASAPEAAPPT